MRNEEDNSLRNVLTAIIFALSTLTGSIGWTDLPNTEYSLKLLELIAEARGECTEAGGELTVDPEAVTKIDITGNDSSDEILSYSALTCSDNNFMFAGGTGGVWYSWIINENHGKFLTRGWSVDYSKSGYPMLSLSLHGTSCGGVGTTPCEKSYVWNTNTSKLEEVVSAARAKFVELTKDELDEVVSQARSLDIYDCYDFQAAYSHPALNEVHKVGNNSIYRISCRLATYNLATIWFQREEQGQLQPIYFEKPVISLSAISEFENVTELMNASLDPETMEVSNHFKWVGHGDQSEGGTWQFDGDGFVLKEYHLDAIADGKANPTTIYTDNVTSNNQAKRMVSCSENVMACTPEELCFEAITEDSNWRDNNESKEAQRRGLTCGRELIATLKSLTEADLKSPRSYAKRCMKDDQTTMSIIHCNLEELELWETLLLERLQSLMASGKGNDPLLFKETLTASQEAWKAYRDAECEHKASLYLGGSLAGIVSTTCHLKITAERVLRLGEHD